MQAMRCLPVEGDGNPIGAIIFIVTMSILFVISQFCSGESRKPTTNPREEE
jgi:hypothetical protein